MKPSLTAIQNLIPRLQRFGYNSTVYLGHWPRLLHLALLALKGKINR